MKPILFSVFLFITSFISAQNSKPYFSWGVYRWSLKAISDTMPASGINYTFDGNDLQKYVLEKPFYDTLLIIDPVTLEEQQRLYRYDTFQYSFKWNIKAKDFVQLLSIKPQISDTSMVATYLDMSLWHKSDIYHWFWFITEGEKVDKGDLFKKGDEVMVQFYIYNPSTNHDQALGCLLFVLL